MINTDEMNIEHKKRKNSEGQRPKAAEKRQKVQSPRLFIGAPAGDAGGAPNAPNAPNALDAPDALEGVSNGGLFGRSSGDMVAQWFDGNYEFSYGGSFPSDDDRPERIRYTTNLAGSEYYNQAVWVLASFCALNSDESMACQSCGGSALWRKGEHGTSGRAQFCVMLKELREAAAKNMSKSPEARASAVKEIMKKYKNVLIGSLSRQGQERLLHLVGTAPYDSGVSYIAPASSYKRPGAY
jgi:hypothetical protein